MLKSMYADMPPQSTSVETQTDFKKNNQASQTAVMTAIVSSNDKFVPVIENLTETFQQISLDHGQDYCIICHDPTVHTCSVCKAPVHSPVVHSCSQMYQGDETRFECMLCVLDHGQDYCIICRDPTVHTCTVCKSPVHSPVVHSCSQLYEGDETRFECMLCVKSSGSVKDTENEIVNSIAVPVSKPEWPCPKCNCSFKKKYNLDRHLKKACKVSKT
jgi:hypothetical protein